MSFSPSIAATAHYGFIESLGNNSFSETHTNLSEDQVALLEQQGNMCSDWTRVFISTFGAYESLLRVRNCVFSGTIYIGTFDGSVTLPNKSTAPSGLYNSTFYGRCDLNDNCYVLNCCSVGNVIVGKHACLMQCSDISGPPDGEFTSFGEGVVVTVGPENTTEGTSRKFTLLSSSTYGHICRKLLTVSLSNLVVALPIVRSLVSVICDHAFVSQSDVVNSFIGRSTLIKNSTVSNSTVVAVSPSESTNVVITDSRISGSVIHDHCTVDNNATLDTVLMFAYSGVGTNAHVVHSILASDSSIAHGECVRSVVGPFVGFHHTSLLIATCWVLGRGNIGYGGMIGANHTGRSNDQQCLLGEGCFVGLSSALKFPFNTLQSPYSIIAASTVCLPQRIAFPFSLISSQESNPPCVSLALNAIKPGWILWGNPYFIERCMTKFTKRRQSPQYRTDFPIFRPSIVDMVVTARDELNALLKDSEGDRTQFFSASQCKSLGKCIVSYEDVEKAIPAYSKFIQRYALHGYLYLLLLQQCNGNDELSQLRFQVGYVNESSLSSFAADVEAMETHSGTVEQHLTYMSRTVSAGSEGFRDLHGVLNRLDNCKRCCLLADSHVVLGHQLQVLEKEFFCNTRGPMPLDESLLMRLVELEYEYARGVRESKAKDVTRAEAIIPEYSETVREFVSPGDAWESSLSKEDVDKVLSLDDTVVNAEQRAKHVEAAVIGLIDLYIRIETQLA